jgi:hypothetical protein
MRFAKSMVVSAFASVMAVGTVGVGTGCGGSSSSTSGNTGGNGSGGGTVGCAPGDSCPAVVDECLGLVDNSSSTTFGLRIAQLSITSPTVLAEGTVADLVSGGVEMKLPSCNLSTGTGRFSWLIEVDEATGDVRTGGALPVADPTTGYSFVTDAANGVEPVVLTGAYADGTIVSPEGVVDILTVPIYLDDAGTEAVFLPLRSPLIDATVSTDKSCIGAYNASQLLPANNCIATGDQLTFSNAGSLDGHVTIEDSDKVIVDVLGASLCTILTGEDDDGLEPDGSPNPDGFKHCPTDAAGAYTVTGDWCSTTNSAGGCADAFHLVAEFAASSVQINN